MNNEVRGMLQRHLEARWLRQMGGPARGRVLEVGCGRGLGAEIIVKSSGRARS